MELALFAYTLGLVNLLLGLPLLFQTERAVRWIRRAVGNMLLLQSWCTALFILAMIAILQNPVFGTSLHGIIRIVALVMAVQCLLICWFPRIAQQGCEQFLRRPQWITLGSLGVCIIGVMLVAAGMNIR